VWPIRNARRYAPAERTEIRCTEVSFPADELPSAIRRFCFRRPPPQRSVNCKRREHGSIARTTETEVPAGDPSREEQRPPGEREHGGDKLFIRAEVANEDIKNNIWNEIKKVDPQYSDLTADIKIDSSLPQPASASAERKYTVQSGDTLSAIAQRFYGKAGEYRRIFEANKDRLSDPDHVRAGQELVIPG
jgi:nucleoid-associated protein YgaU